MNATDKRIARRSRGASTARVPRRAAVPPKPVPCMEEQASLARQRTNRLDLQRHGPAISEITRTREEIADAVRALCAHRAEIADKLDHITALLSALIADEPRRPTH